MYDVGTYLSHYASKYYDPAKAREYYLKTRELKGRRSASDLKSEAKKEAWGYTEKQITAAKKLALDRAAAVNKAKVEVLRNNAQEERAEISSKLKSLMEAVSEKAKARREELAAARAQEAEAITAKAKADIEALPKIPSGLSKADRIKAQEERSAEIERIRGEASSSRADLKAVADSVRDDISGESKESRALNSGLGLMARTKVANDLKSSLDGAKNAYASKKEQIKASYEKTYDREFEGIKKHV